MYDTHFEWSNEGIRAEFAGVVYAECDDLIKQLRRWHKEVEEKYLVGRRWGFKLDANRNICEWNR